MHFHLLRCYFLIICSLMCSASPALAQRQSRETGSDQGTSMASLLCTICSTSSNPLCFLTNVRRTCQLEMMTKRKFYDPIDNFDGGKFSASVPKNFQAFRLWI
uniref:Uncharacterized protein n=1 Tax=Romanomermis culicivorax TaxID=13658 RepID=A0A915IV71_ROMCU